MSQQTLTNPEELFQYQLRSALTMEEHSLEALEELHSVARDAKIKKLFSHHKDETKEQMSNLEKVFKLLDRESTTAPSPATTGIKNQAASLIEKADPMLHDQVALMSALGNEHFEISAYDGLILQARSLRAPEIEELLQANFDQEQHTSEELHAALADMLHPPTD